ARRRHHGEAVARRVGVVVQGKLAPVERLLPAGHGGRQATHLAAADIDVVHGAVGAGDEVRRRAGTRAEQRRGGGGVVAGGGQCGGGAVGGAVGAVARGRAPNRVAAGKAAEGGAREAAAYDARPQGGPATVQVREHRVDVAGVLAASGQGSLAVGPAEVPA